jgi:hypothetical protein
MNVDHVVGCLSPMISTRSMVNNCKMGPWNLRQVNECKYIFGLALGRNQMSTSWKITHNLVDNMLTIIAKQFNFAMWSLIIPKGKFVNGILFYCYVLSLPTNVHVQNANNEIKLTSSTQGLEWCKQLSIIMWANYSPWWQIRHSRERWISLIYTNDKPHNIKEILLVFPQLSLEEYYWVHQSTSLTTFHFQAPIKIDCGRSKHKHIPMEEEELLIMKRIQQQLFSLPQDLLLQC